jgi:hypothetical protein
VCSRLSIYFKRYFVWLKIFGLVWFGLVSNYKKHILSPAEVRKACYSLAELYVKYVNLNLFGCRGATFMNIIKNGASYKRLGTST